jgi:hypothetical protein
MLSPLPRKEGEGVNMRRKQPKTKRASVRSGRPDCCHCASYVTTPPGTVCSWVRLARDGVAKAVRSMRAYKDLCRKNEEDYAIVRDIIAVGIQNGHLSEDCTGVKPLTEIGKRELQHMKEWWDSEPRTSRQAESNVRLYAHAACIEASRTLNQCPHFLAVRRGKECYARALSVLRVLQPDGETDPTT